MTSASTHDSRAAIPLGTQTAGRVENLYDLMDSAYDSLEIRAHSISLGHKPIIDVNPRRSTDLQSMEGPSGLSRPARPGADLPQARLRRDRQSRDSRSAMPESSTGGRSGNRAISESLPPMTTTVRRSVESRRSRRPDTARTAAPGPGSAGSTTRRGSAFPRAGSAREDSPPALLLSRYRAGQARWPVFHTGAMVQAFFDGGHDHGDNH